MGETQPTGSHETWADYVRRAVQLCGGNVSRLKQLSGVSRSSLYRWMDGTGTQVTIDKARQIAQAIGDDPANALRAAGSLLEREPIDMDDPVVMHIMGLDIDDELKQVMLDRHQENLEYDRKRYIEQVNKDIEFLRRRNEDRPDGLDSAAS